MGTMLHYIIGRTRLLQGGQDIAEGGVPVEGGTPLPPKPEKCMKLVELIQFMQECGNIPEDMVWIILILTPNGNKDT